MSRTELKTIGIGLALGLALGGCTKEFPLENDLFSFEVTLSGDPDLGSEGDPLTYVAGSACSGVCPDGQACVNGFCGMPVTFTAKAIGRNGNDWPHRGPVRLRVTPGIILESSDVVIMDEGVAEDITVHIARGLGPTHLWVEADGYLPLDAELDYGQCNDGIDNDHNGLIDLADAGCDDASDDLEAPVNLATGVSPTFHFDNPTVHDVQSTPMLHESPLQGEQIRVSSGTLVVTNVTSNGFYVVDLRDNTPDKLFASMFVFTFSKPQGVDYGDRLCGFSGAVQEHVGMTQVVFPSYELYYADNEACQDFPGLDPSAKVPAPWPLTELLVEEDPALGRNEYLANVYANSQLLERYEGNLVTFTDVELATRFIACDKNDNGSIDNGTPEDTCRDDCQDDPDCVDLEGYFEFNQYRGTTGGRKSIYGSTVLADKFKPLSIGYIGDEDANGRCERQDTPEGFIQYQCPPMRLESLTGSLRHIYLCGNFSTEDRCDLQFWVIDPRFDGDVVVAEQ